MYLALHSFDEIGRFPVTRSPNMRTCKANFHRFQKKEDSPRQPYILEMLFKCFLLCRFFPQTFMMNGSPNHSNLDKVAVDCKQLNYTLHVVGRNLSLFHQFQQYLAIRVLHSNALLEEVHVKPKRDGGWSEDLNQTRSAIDSYLHLLGRKRHQIQIV